MIPRKTGSETSEPVASIASRGLLRPGSLTLEEIKQVCGAALVQREPPTIPIRPRSLKTNAFKDLAERLKSESSAPTPPPEPRWWKHLKSKG